MEFIGAIIALICALYVIINVWGSNASTLAKLLWTFFAIVANILTAIIYFFIGPKSA